VANGNKLKKVKDEHIILGLIQRAKENASEMFIWKLVGKTKHLGQVRIESVRKFRSDFCIIPSDGQERIVQDLMSGSSYIDIYIPDSVFMVRAQVKQTEAPIRYYLHFPIHAAQVERRSDVRLNVHDEREVRINFFKSTSEIREKTQSFTKDVFDLSAGGFSFLVSRMESKFFDVGDNISAITIEAGTWRSQVSAQITMIREVEPDKYNQLQYKVWRICCRFSNIDQVSRKYLENYIFQRIKEELHAING